MRYWVMRTDRRFASELIVPELRDGRLRQGWGYRPDQDLRLVRDACFAGQGLNEHQAATWRRNWRLLPDEEDSIAQGDLMVLPNLPRVGFWSVAEAADDYDYRIAPVTSDHGHVRTVSLIREEIAPCEASVDARLRRSMRCQLPLWNVDPLGESVEALKGQAPAASHQARDPLEDCLHASTEALWNRLQRHFGGAEFEEPIRLLLGQLYGVVEYRGGRGERGADFICRARDPLGTEFAVAVQLKMWTGTAVDPRPLEQLRLAHASWPGITSGVVITTAEDIDASFLEVGRQLEEDTGMRVKIIARQELLGLLARELPVIVAHGSGCSLRRLSTSPR